MCKIEKAVANLLKYKEDSETVRVFATKQLHARYKGHSHSKGNAVSYESYRIVEEDLIEVIFRYASNDRGSFFVNLKGDKVCDSCQFKPCTCYDM